MSFPLHSFHGGMRLDDHKAESLQQGLQQAGLPEQLFLPLNQGREDSSQTLVKVGDRVLRGQLLADNLAPGSVPLHAPTSGLVQAIALHPVPHPCGQDDICLTLQVDGEDQVMPSESVDADLLSVPELILRIRSAGIVGLGGGAFPTAAKLSRGVEAGIDTLIINGVECEPYISCDDMLMQYYADQIIRGICYLQRILEPKYTLFAIEDNKGAAIKSIQRALEMSSLRQTELVVIPTVYPSGGEKQLIKVLTGKEVPSAKLAIDMHLLCQNVATCAAISRALEQGQALTSRIVTLSGDGISQPGNWEVRLGTPMSHLIELAGGYRGEDKALHRLVMGGPMMGFRLRSDRTPVVKATNSILVMQEKSKVQTDHAACVHCGACAEVCPATLLPQQLYLQARAQNYPGTEKYHLFDCIECGCCAAVCPSQIPLVHYYRVAKTNLLAARESLLKSNRARVRFENREKRLLLKKQQDEIRRDKKRAALQKRAEKNTNTVTNSDPVQAVLERVRVKKQVQLLESENTSPVSADPANRVSRDDLQGQTTQEQSP